VIIFLLGVSDDLFGTYPRTKFIVQCLVASGVACFGGVIKILPHNGLNFFLTVFWIVGLTNSLNLLDNMDGLSSGIASIAALGLFGLAVITGQTTVGLLGLALAGSCLGFLRYNFHPAKIFMGDCGAMFLGYTLATLAVFCSWQHRSSLTVSLLAPGLILCVPIFDTTLVTILRIRHRRAPWLGGRDHASHRLVTLLGGSEKGAVLILYGVGIVTGGTALLAARLNSPIATILITAAFGVGLMWFGAKLAEVECYQKE
jgi:UDP-GlcNAc:undecaprenyl-phosphate/decaprenyl-phosphate GlcNAc-1-phosphate transferase